MAFTINLSRETINSTKQTQALYTHSTPASQTEFADGSSLYKNQNKNKKKNLCLCK